MNLKDITEKKLEDFADVFADIINVLLFDGERRVNSKHLQAALPRSIYKAEGKLSEQERDIAKYWRDETTCFALLGLENETKKDVKKIPLRIISYDGSEYRAQIRKRDDIARQNAKQEDKNKRKPLPEFYPVVTIVLYFGLVPWKEPINLKSCFNIPDGLEDYVNDYKINLFQVAFLDDATVAKFQSDFKIVAEYFVESRKMEEGLIEKSTFSMEGMVHILEVLELMRALTGDESFEKAYNGTLKGGKDQVDTLINFIQQRADREAERANREAERAEKEAERAEKEAERAEKEAERAEKEAERAEKEAEKNQILENRIKVLEERLKQLGTEDLFS